MPWGARRSARIAHYFSLGITHITNKYIPRSLQPYVLNYIDDHIFRGQTQIECLYVHVTYIFICDYLRVKLKQSKTVLAAQEIVALGFDIDLTPNKRTIDIETYKQTKYTNNIKKFLESDTHTTEQGQTLAGQLEHVAPLKWPLKCYIRALHNVIPRNQIPHEEFRVTPQLENSLIAWQRAITIIDPTKLTDITNPTKTFDEQITTDASNAGYGWMRGTEWGFGAFYTDEVDPNDEHNTVQRELYPIGVTLTAIAPTSSQKHILIWSDNDNAVQALTNKDIRNEKAQEMVIYICELAMKYNFRFYIAHIKGKINVFADALSRLQIPRFKRLCEVNNKTIDQQPTQYDRLPIKLGTQLHTTHAPIKIDNTIGHIPNVSNLTDHR